MEIRDYVRIIVKRWWLFFLFVAIAGGTAYVYSKAQEPIYRSTSKLYVMPGRVDYGNVLVIQNLVRQYSRLVLTDRLLTSISEELKLDLSPETLRGRIHTQGTSEDNAILIQVDDPDPAKAPKIAKALALEFVADQQRRMQSVTTTIDRIDVMMYDEPTPPSLYRPRTKVNVMAGAVLGVLLAVIVAFGLEFLDDTIKNSEDVERYIALPVVGSIPTIGS